MLTFPRLAWPPLRWPPLVLPDARDNQLVFLSLFLGLGLLARGWHLQPAMIAIAILTCLGTQLLWTLALGAWSPWGQRLNALLNATSAPLAGDRPPTFSACLATFNWRSPLITSLSLSLLLRVGHPQTMMLAAIAAISSKFLLKSAHKHLFNPANFGIITVFLLTRDAWVSPGQWGEEMWYVFLFLGAGGLVLKRVGRWDTSLTFLASYALLEAGRNLWLGWTWDVWLHRMMSGSLLVFALFMITDPRSSPNARGGRILWAVAIAALTFGLRNGLYLSSAMFWALFTLSLCTPLFDAIYPDTRFTWAAVQRRVTPFLSPRLHLS